MMIIKTVPLCDRSSAQQMVSGREVHCVRLVPGIKYIDQGIRIIDLGGSRRETARR